MLNVEIGRRLLRLRNFGEVSIPQMGVVTRMDEEFKVSPHGDEGLYDVDAYWIPLAEVDEVVYGSRNYFQEILSAIPDE